MKKPEEMTNRELDIEISENIFNRKVRKCGKYGYYTGNDYLLHYSTNIEYAIYILYKLIEMKIYFEIHPFGYGSNQKGWYLTGYSGYDASRRSECDGEAETLSKAICLAALNSIEKKLNPAEEFLKGLT